MHGLLSAGLKLTVLPAFAPAVMADPPAENAGDSRVRIEPGGPTRARPRLNPSCARAATANRA